MVRVVIYVHVNGPNREVVYIGKWVLMVCIVIYVHVSDPNREVVYIGKWVLMVCIVIYVHVSDPNREVVSIGRWVLMVCVVIYVHVSGPNREVVYIGKWGYAILGHWLVAETVSIRVYTVAHTYVSSVLVMLVTPTSRSLYVLLTNAHYCISIESSQSESVTYMHIKLIILNCYIVCCVLTCLPGKCNKALIQPLTVH